MAVINPPESKLAKSTSVECIIASKLIKTLSFTSFKGKWQKSLELYDTCWEYGNKQIILIF